MKLYHASTSHYDNGQIVGPFTKNRFIENKILPSGYQSVEYLLEQARPKTKFSRLNAVYAFADPGQCISYLRGERIAQFFLYEVAMASTTICPMPLVDIIRKHEGSTQVVEALIREYWEPHKEWRFMEHLAGSLQILAEVDIDQYATLSYAAFFKYQEDMKQGSEFASLLQASIKEIDMS